MLDQKVIGHEFPDRRAVIERGQLSLFAAATGEADPVHFDADAAQAQGHRDVLAPPTFAFCLDQLTKSQCDWVEELGIDIHRMLHAEQSFDYHRDLYAGDEVVLKSRVADHYTKKDGALEFIVVETDLFNQDSERCVNQRTTVVVRHG